MSDLQELYVLLAAIYLVDCLHGVRRDARVFVARWKRFRLQEGGALFGNSEFGWNLAWPLPPLGTLHVCDVPVLALGAQGVYGSRLLEWEVAASVRAEARHLHEGPRRYVRASSARQAALWAANLRELAALSPEARAKELEHRERARYDTRWVAERRAAAAREQARLMPFAQAQVFLCFLLVPLAIARVGLVPALPWLLVALVGVQLSGVVMFARTHARLEPAATLERRAALASVAISPPGLMRAVDLLTRDLYCGAAPLAVASVLLERADFERAAGRALRAARHPPPPRENEPRELLAEAREREQRALERFLRAQDLDPERLDAPPERLGEDCLCYCPRCQSQFVIPAGICTACSGVELAPFALAP
ncbi:MAG: hypothetical protein IPJ19_00540 [Planctomycetes bacterium]|nr:hypothetical protein [Planctomycetota bacterium]